MGYSEKLGKSNAVAWATECAKQSRGVLYYRKSPEEPEEEMATFLDYGKRSKQKRISLNLKLKRCKLFRNLRMANKVSVYFPIIAYGGMCRAEFAMSTSALFVKCLQEHPHVSFSSTGILFESLVSRARNASAAALLHYKCDRLLFIDADINFDANDVFKLIKHDKDVVCGAYAKKYYNKQKVAFLAKHNPEVFATDSWKELATDYTTEFSSCHCSEYRSSKNLVEVNYAATGFMLIKTNVFKKIIKERPDLKYKNEVDGYMSWGDNFMIFSLLMLTQRTESMKAKTTGFVIFGGLWEVKYI